MTANLTPFGLFCCCCCYCCWSHGCIGILVHPSSRLIGHNDPFVNFFHTNGVQWKLVVTPHRLNAADIAHNHTRRSIVFSVSWYNGGGYQMTSTKIVVSFNKHPGWRGRKFPLKVAPQKKRKRNHHYVIKWLMTGYSFGSYAPPNKPVFQADGLLKIATIWIRFKM